MMRTAGRRSGLPKNRIVSFLESLIGLQKKPLKFCRFINPLGDFEIQYPRDWRFDRDIAVMEGKYTISFESRHSSFTISVDTDIQKGFSFSRYAKAELESPTSGIYTPMKKSSFRKMPAYRRGYSYTSEGKDYFGGGLMFFTGKAVFSISWSGPEIRKQELQHIFEHMLKSMIIREGVLIRRWRTVKGWAR
jgi:hypothetical protein